MFGRIKLFMKRRRHRRAHRLHYEENNDAYVFINDVIKKFHQGGGLKHDHQAYKLFCLQELLQKYRPRNILELGTGTSTACIAKYCYENEAANSICIDENADWLAHTQNLVSQYFPVNRMQFLRKVRKHEFDEENLFFSYGDALPEKQFDFILVDGPSMKLKGVRRKDGICKDALEYIEMSEKLVVVIDFRESTANYFYKRKDDLKISLKMSDLYEDKVNDEAYDYFTVIEKRG